MHNANELLDKLSQEVAAVADDNSVLIGIHTGGAWVAEAINQRLPQKLPLGTLNITFYRDDFTRIGLHPNVEPSDIHFDIEDKTVILVDDVLYTGRTIRAALNELFDFGRPARVILAVLIERDGQELPIKADIAGKRMQLKAEQCIKLRGPEPIEYEIKD